MMVISLCLTGGLGAVQATKGSSGHDEQEASRALRGPGMSWPAFVLGEIHFLLNHLNFRISPNIF